MRNTATGGRTDGEADGHDARLRTLFMAAVDLAAADRAAFLADACGDDDTLRGELEALLVALDDARTDALLPPLFPEAALPDAPGPDTLDDLAVGQPVGPYRIVRRIAEGGMGTVYLAERDDIGRRVALKLVRHGRLASPEQLRRFLLERQILARLEHPGIARLLDAGMTEQQLPYLVMEYVEGVPLDRHCDERRLPIDQRLALFARVCEAVQAAHEAHVVHRDLKPSNILVTATGEPRLLDFGIAKLLDDAGAGEVGLTRPGSPLATPEYASPEQLRGQPVSVASDVYSLGVILYELLTGWRPEPAGHSRGASEHAGGASGPPPPSAVVRRAARGMERVERVAPWPIAAVRGTVPDRLARRLAGDLDRIVLQALQAEPTRRYASVAALRADLVRHLTGRPVQAAADTLLERVRRWHGRRRAPRAALGTAVAILALVTALAGAIAAGLPGAWRTAPDGATPAAPAGADGATVLVLPFGVQGERSQPGVGPALTELVARGLDGLGDLRGVEPRVAGELVAGAGPMATPAGGRRLAARAGARLYVVGDVTLAGGRLRTTAALYDRAGSDAPLATAVVDGDARRLFEVADALVARLAAGWLRAPRERIAQSAARTTRSLPALRAFLEGEAHFRVGAFARAAEAYRRAVAEDSALALGWYRLGQAGTWLNVPDDSTNALFERALRHPERLSMHDRQLVEAFLAWRRGDFDRAEQLYRRLVGLEPADVEAWFQLGEVLFHGNPVRGRTLREARQPLEHVLATDARDREALVHLARISALEGRYAELDSLTARILALSPGGDEALDVRAIQAFASGDAAARQAVLAELARASDDVLGTAMWRVPVFTRDLEAAERLARLGTASWRDSARIRRHATAYLSDLALARGRLRAAAVERRRLAALLPESALPLHARQAAVRFLPYPRSELLAVRDSLARRLTELDRRSGGDVGTSPVAVSLLYHIGITSARLGDSTTAERAAAEIERRPAATPAEERLRRGYVNSLRGLAAWERGDLATAAASLHVLDASRRSGTGWPYERFVVAEVLRQTGHPDEALGWYESLGETDVNEMPFLAMAHRGRGLIHEARGEVGQARAHYARVIELWKACDPELRPLVRDIERRLARLRAR